MDNHCNAQKCPEKGHCVYLTCRTYKNAVGHYSIQVYHHRKEAPSVHHCKLFEGPHDEVECHCFCYYHTDSPALTTRENTSKLKNETAVNDPQKQNWRTWAGSAIK